jgi:tetratricopeptide (TPR) repeat protein
VPLPKRNVTGQSCMCRAEKIGYRRGTKFLLRLGSFVIVTGTAFVGAQSPPSVGPIGGVRPSSLSKQCLQSRSSEKISALLETIHEHPTAGAYNTLGVLYAQADRVACAIPAFETALKLEDQNWEVHYNLALALLRKGDRTLATRELQVAIQQKPDSVSARFALGTLFENEQKLSDGEDELRSVLKLDPKFTPASLKLSEVLIAEGRPQSAVTVLQDATKQAPTADQAALLETALGAAYAEAGDGANALATLKNVVAARPDSADAHFNLGMLYAKQSQPEQKQAAVAEFQEALQLKAGMDASRLALGQVLLSLQKYSEAVPVVLEYTRRMPKDPQGFYALASGYEGVGNNGAAIDALERAASLAPKDANVRFQLGVQLARSGKTSEAIQQLRDAERIRPSDAETHHQLALLLEKAGETERARDERARFTALKSVGDREAAIARFNDEGNRSLSAGNPKAAEENYRKAVQLRPSDGRLHYNLSLALDRLRDLPSEQKELERAVKLDANLAVAHNQLGLLALQGGQYAQAERRFKKALAIDPKFAEAEGNLGVLYSQQGKKVEAASLFQQAIQNDPKYAKAYVNLGLLMAQQGASLEAERQFRTAIQVDSSYAGAYAALGMLQAKTGHGSEAVKNFQHAVALDPGSAEAHLNLGIALVDQFDRPGGLKEFSEAVRLDPNLSAAHYNLGRFFFETGKYEDAGRELEAAIRLQPDSAGALYFLALTAKQLNQLKRSAELLQKVVGLQPGNSDAQYLLGQNLERSGDISRAIEHWKAAVQADPNHSQALYNLAKSLDKMHDPEAKQYRDHFEALQRSQQITDRVSELGNFALEAANAQNWPQAMEQMNEAIQLCGTCSQSAHLHKNLGLFYGRTGSVGEAEKELHTALALVPDDAEVQNALAMIERIRKEQSK